MDNFDFLLQDLRQEYSKRPSNSIKGNYGRPARIEMKDGTIYGVAWFQWEHQNQFDLNNQILCFNSGRDIDKFKISFQNMRSINWG